MHGLVVPWYGGLFQLQQQSFRNLLVVLVSANLLVFIVLVVEFRSFYEPIAIVFGAGAGAQMLQPLGIAVMGALIFSVPLSLIATPVLYALMIRIHRRHLERHPAVSG